MRRFAPSRLTLVWCLSLLSSRWCSSPINDGDRHSTIALAGAEPITDGPSESPTEGQDFTEDSFPPKSDNAPQLVIDETFMNYTLTVTRVNLYLEEGRIVDDFLDDFDYFKDYRNKVDQAFVGQKDGKCFVAFRGSTGFLDALQNFIPGFHTICPTGEGHGCWCKARKGFYLGYNTGYRSELEADIQECVNNCTDFSFDTCLVVSGHSQGGSIAHVATVALNRYNPLTITTGHGRTLSRKHCPDVLNATRMVRFVNSRHGRIHGMAYDRWPFFHQIDHLMYNHGVTYILADDVPNLANIGVNGWQVGFLPDDTAHALTRPDDDQGGYLNRIERIIANGTFPVNTNGYGPGYYCSRNVECQSRKCTRPNKFHHWVKYCE